jgi:DNA-binding GntR family transcriptional regulator
LVLSAKNVQRSRSLHEQTYQALRESILSGELAPGDRLIETQIAEQLQVSRTPIREAIRQLQREELVTADELGWLRVATVSPKEAMHLYDCRIALEALSVTGACENASDFQLKQLKELVTQAEKLVKRKASNPDSNQLLELDYQFHRTIAQSSGNTCLVSLLDQVFGKMALLQVQTTRHNPSVLEIRTEHQLLYEAIAQRDIEAATQKIRNHLTASKARVVQELENLQQYRKSETTHQ